MNLEKTSASAPVAHFEPAKNQLQEMLERYTFTPATPEEYARNIGLLAKRAEYALKLSVCSTVLLGRYCRDVGHDLKSKGKGEFGAWLKTNLPEVPYSAISTAMRIAGDLSKRHPEMRRIDTEEKVQQLTLLIDGKSLTAFGKALRGEPEAPAANVDPETGKRKHFPSAKTPVERAEDADELGRKNFREAFDRLVVEVESGNAALLCDEELERYVGLLGDLGTKIRTEILEPRRKTAAKGKARSVTDL